MDPERKKIESNSEEKSLPDFFNRRPDDMRHHLPNYQNKKPCICMNRNAIYESNLKPSTLKCNGYCSVEGPNWKPNTQNLGVFNSMHSFSEYTQKFQDCDSNRIYWQNKSFSQNAEPYPDQTGTKRHQDININQSAGNMWVKPSSIENADKWTCKSVASTVQKFDVIMNKNKAAEAPIECNNFYTYKRSSATESFPYNSTPFGATVTEKSETPDFFKKAESLANSRLRYASNSIGSNPLYNEVDTFDEMPHTSKIIKINSVDHRIINTSNVLHVEEHISPNYVRERRQVFSESEIRSSHNNLYVPPPHFSEDNFNSIQERKESLEEYRASSSNSSFVISTQDQSPLQISKYECPNKINLNEPRQIVYHHNSVVSNVRNNIYTCSKARTPDVMSPIIAKQTHTAANSNNLNMNTEYVSYSRSQQPQTVDYSQSAATVRIKKEDETIESLNRGYYPGAYNSIDNCYVEKHSEAAKQFSSPGGGYISQGPIVDQHQSYDRYNNVIIEKQHLNNISTLKEGVNPFYYEMQPQYKKKVQSSTHMKYYPLNENKELNNSVIIEHSTNETPNGSYTFSKIVQPEKCTKEDLKKINQIKVSPLHSTSMKKVQSKPNYRELINHVYAMRNSTTEEDLNLKIINRTLNYSPQIPRQVENVVSKDPCINYRKASGASYRSHQDVENTYVTVPHNAILPTDVISDPRFPIKQEDAPSSFSPLDLSMRTVRSKADSTECNNLSVPSVIRQTECKYSIPKVDFTPNFARHTNVDATKSANRYYQQNTTKLRKTATTENSFVKIQQNYDHAMLKFDKNRYIDSAKCSSLKMAPPQNVMKYPETIEAKFAPQNHNTIIVKNISNLSAVRPTVVEENPNATKKIDVYLPPFELTKVLPDDRVLPEKLSDPQMAKPLPAVDVTSITEKNVKDVKSLISTKEENYKYFGRKRHLKEFTKTFNAHVQNELNEPISKYSRISKPGIEVPMDVMPNFIYQANVIDNVSVSVHNTNNNIALNVLNAQNTVIKNTYEQVTIVDSPKTALTAEKSIQAEVPKMHLNINTHTNFEDVKCKEEPLTPNESKCSPMPIKSDTPSIIAARIRTKAELKGFTFTNTLHSEMATAATSKVKIEQTSEDSKAFKDNCSTEPPELSEEISSVNLNDWTNACNDLVEQLLGHTKKRLKKRQTARASGDDLSTLTVATVESQNVVHESNGLQAPTYTSKLANIVKCKIELNDSAITRRSTSWDIYTTNSQKKISKSDREKMRLQQEKRIAARLQKMTSSESENELTKQRTQRSKKPTKKIKNRASVGKRRYSDCGSDSSTDAEDTNTKKQLDYNKNDNCISPSKTILNPTISIGSLNICNEMITRKKRKELLNENDDDHQNIRESNQVPRVCDMSSPTKILNNNKDGEKKNVSLPENNLRKGMFHSKFGNQHTITRSKRKRELEQQLANSIILRNEKIVRNSTTNIKRKFVEKFTKQPNKTTLHGDKLKEDNEREMVSTRSHSKTTRFAQSRAKNNNNLIYNKDKLNRSKTKTKKQVFAKESVSMRDNAKNSQQRQTELYLEVYRYKRALKIPPSLISIRHPNNHRISASLPDLERETQENTSTSKSKSKITKAGKPITNDSKENNKSQSINSEEPKSIIDLLHSRVLKSKSRSKKIPQKTYSLHTTLHSEIDLHNHESNSVSDLLLPLPTKEQASQAPSKTAHFSVFDTQVLKSRTRTEYKKQQNKEIIREIFVGEDRPASAPPEMTQIDGGNEKITYEQKYEQFLQQMNIVVGDNKLRKFGNRLQQNNHQQHIQEEFNADFKSAIDVNQKLDSGNRLNSFSAVSSNVHKRKKSGKHFRRKCSSGFDYIRKKKKPNPIGSTQGHLFVKTEKLEEEDETEKAKTESDVCKEIQKWVLNKGVGQSTLHKAARLGYIDVIVYCLERMGLNPDQKDNAGYTPLHEACVNGCLDIARILLQYGANHSEAAHSGIRPLHEASENDHIEIVRMLLSYGADPLLATYAGQTPLMLATSRSMKEIISNHLKDVQHMGPEKPAWRFPGPWKLNDVSTCGYDIFNGSSCLGVNHLFDKGPSQRHFTNGSESCLSNKNIFKNYDVDSKSITNNCAVVLDNIDHFNSVRLYKESNRGSSVSKVSNYECAEFLVETSDGEGDMFEFEEADILLPPLYLLKDEGMDKWVLLTDLCNLLKVKSKDTLLNKIYPASSISAANKNMLRELKMSDFLEKATCLQLLCTGEKVNICASKVVLIKYNESVRNLLGVKTILMKF